MSVYEINFDGIVGPTHNYAGLSLGNVASLKHRGLVSHPKEAALEGLAKMKFLADRGVKQGVFPPHERPLIAELRKLGIKGSDAAVIEKAYRQHSDFFIDCTSASAMWLANAGTMTPSTDAADGKVHFTPANLVSKRHRSLETPFTSVLLKTIFHDGSFFVHHEAVEDQFGDEGAANHTRLCPTSQDKAVHFFVYGKSGSSGEMSKKFPARQALEASQEIVRKHGLTEKQVFFAQQNPYVIDCGVFHNDVISVGNEHVFLYHEEAFVETEAVMESLKKRIEGLIPIRVDRETIPVEKAVETYLFNSQLVTLPGGEMLMVSPQECHESEDINSLLNDIVEKSGNPITEVAYLDLRQSMQNGGGPACLRFRVLLQEEEIASIQPRVFLDDLLYRELVDWVEKHYREDLSQEDLGDPIFYEENCVALDELTKILQCGSLYSFQR